MSDATTYQVGYLIGSFTTHSLNRRLSKALVRLLSSCASDRPAARRCLTPTASAILA